MKMKKVIMMEVKMKKMMMNMMMEVKIELRGQVGSADGAGGLTQGKLPVKLVRGSGSESGRLNQNIED